MYEARNFNPGEINCVGLKRGAGMHIFDNLELTVKNDILEKYARLATTVSYYHYTIKLYSWDKFFIEEYFDNEEKKVTRITVADERDMHKYLVNLNISELGIFVAH